MTMSQNQPAHNPRVLLVDDDPFWVKELTRRIKKGVASAEIRVADTFMGGWNALDGSETDLLVTDIGLPRDAPPPNKDEKLGMELGQPGRPMTGEPHGEDEKLGMELVQLAQQRRIPCVVVTGSNVVGVSDTVKLSRKYGARGVFIKKHLFEAAEAKEFLECVTPILTAERENPRRELEDTRWSDEVVIEEGTKTFTLYRKHQHGRMAFPVPGGFRLMFYLFVKQIAAGAGHEPLSHSEANLALEMAKTAEEDMPMLELVHAFELAMARECGKGPAEESPKPPTARTSKKAGGPLRKAKHDLNKELKENLGPPPIGEDWIDLGDGYQLNGSISWKYVKKPEDNQTDPVPQEKLDRAKRPREFSTNPKTLEVNTPDHKDSLPAQATRKPRDKQGEP
jgi:hypothetical protein